MARNQSTCALAGEGNAGVPGGWKSSRARVGKREFPLTLGIRPLKNSNVLTSPFLLAMGFLLQKQLQSHGEITMGVLSLLLAGFITRWPRFPQNSSTELAPLTKSTPALELVWCILDTAPFEGLLPYCLVYWDDTGLTAKWQPASLTSWLIQPPLAATGSSLVQYYGCEPSPTAANSQLLFAFIRHWRECNTGRMWPTWEADRWF